jgi:hypothetical protein
MSKGLAAAKRTPNPPKRPSALDAAKLANAEAQLEQIRKAVGASEGEATLAAVGRGLRQASLATGALMREADIMTVLDVDSSLMVIPRIHELLSKAAESDGAEIFKFGRFTLRYRRDP